MSYGVRSNERSIVAALENLRTELEATIRTLDALQREAADRPPPTSQAAKDDGRGEGADS